MAGNFIHPKFQAAANPAQRFLQNAHSNVANSPIRFLAPAHGTAVDGVQKMIIHFFYMAGLVAKLGKDPGNGGNADFKLGLERQHLKG